MISLICIESRFWIRMSDTIITGTEIDIVSSLEDIWLLIPHDIDVGAIWIKF